ncbi:MAG: hypothetical protein H7249_12415 [Chitinophagaceae bacterium]|nr:hypothetical protein [Oligoflexus sp.]
MRKYACLAILALIACKPLQSTKTREEAVKAEASGATQTTLGLVNLEATPLPQTIALRETSKLQKFALRSLYIGIKGKSYQYRVDLAASTFSRDELQNNQWESGAVENLSTEQKRVITRALTEKSRTYKACKVCSNEVHMLVLESTQGEVSAKSYAMSEECICGPSDERQPNLAFSSLQSIEKSLQ